MKEHYDPQACVTTQCMTRDEANYDSSPLTVFYTHFLREPRLHSWSLQCFRLNVSYILHIGFLLLFLFVFFSILLFPFTLWAKLSLTPDLLNRVTQRTYHYNDFLSNWKKRTVGKNCRKRAGFKGTCQKTRHYYFKKVPDSSPISGILIKIPLFIVILYCYC